MYSTTELKHAVALGLTEETRVCVYSTTELKHAVALGLTKETRVCVFYY